MTALYAEPRHVADPSDCFFYHTVDLPEFGEQKGEWDLRGAFADYTDHFDFTGKRVLDIGAGSGFLSFSAEAAGAAEVVSFDMDSSVRQDFLPFAGKHAFEDKADFVKHRDHWVRQWHNAYWLNHRLSGSTAQVHYGDVYDLPSELGQFDAVIVGSILEHLSDPIKAMAAISRRTAQTMIIVTPMIDSDDRIARFEGDCANPEVDYVFWTYSRGIYQHVLTMLGFEITKIAERQFKAEWAGDLATRHIITAERRVAAEGDH